MQPDITPGTLYLRGNGGGAFLALGMADDEGLLRAAPVEPSDHRRARGVTLRSDETGGVFEAHVVRLDRVRHDAVDDARIIGGVTSSCLARLYRIMAVAEARAYADAALVPQSFEPGTTPIPPSGKVIGANELANLVEASLDGWLTTGRFNDAFQHRLGKFLGRKFVLTTNSGSSANLLALSALTSPLLGDRALLPGDEVITVAAGFPTTVNPIIQHGLIPVFVDVQLGTYNIDPDLLAAAISPRTRAIMIAHTLGNPFDVAAIVEVAKKHDLWLVEDCCDALGSTFGGQKVGTFGDVGTLSFYPAHHITMGEGGAVFTDHPVLKRALESIRDWGRDCYCPPGRDNTCKKRFKWQLGQLPSGYDHKYTYSHLGYNLKITDMQAAVGLAQLERLDAFITARKANFARLHARLSPLERKLILPQATRDSDPAWFGFPITVRPELAIGRAGLIEYLTRRQVGTRLLFAGNLVRQPYFAGRQFRVIGSLANTDLIMDRTFWIGVYPGLTGPMLDYAADCIAEYVREKT
jgi:CDP-6-deoxy-D-xylo-4-hexulose-3-dehydrase